MLERVERVHIQMPVIYFKHIEYWYITKGGTDEVYFKTTEQPEHAALYLMANSSKYG